MPKGKKESISKGLDRQGGRLASVNVPKDFLPIFEKAQDFVSKYFKEKKETPSEGTIEIFGERYILVRSASMSIDFFESVKNLYKEEGEEEAINVARNLLFDIAHAIGRTDAKSFHKIMKLKDPIEKLSAGPVLFSHSGWAFVDILPESRPSPDEDYYLIYDHPFSFESDAWLKAGKTTDFPVCVMNAGYSSGWCEESFGVTLVASEITCKAKGDENCRFIMAPPSRIEGHIKEYLKKEPALAKKVTKYDIPGFFKRKQIEEELRKSEERYRSLVEEAGDGIVAFGVDAKISLINQYLLDLGGYQRDDVMGHDFTEFVPEESLPVVLKMFEETFEGIESPAAEIELKAKDGTLVPVGYKGTIIYDGEDIIGVRGIIRDITARKQAEEELNRYKEHLEELVEERTAELRGSEEKYRKLIETANDAIFLADTGTGLIIDANKKAEKLIGRRRNEIIGMHQTEVHPDGMGEQYREIFERHIRDGQAIEEDVYVKHKDGHLIPVSISASAFELGKKSVIQGIFHDLTEHKKADKALQESEERFRQIAENALEWIWEVDTNGLYTYASPVIEKILGYKTKEVIGKKYFYDLIHPENRDELKRVAFEVFAKRQPFRKFLNRNMHKNGREVWLSTSGVPILDRDGNLLGYRGADTDITERKMAERKIIELKEISESTIRNSPVGILTTDMDGAILSVNPALLDMLGSPSEERTKEFNVLTMKPLVKQGFSKLFDKCLKKGKNIKVESMPYISLWGKSSVVSLNIVSLLDAEGKQMGMVSLIEDITDRKKAERELHESEEHFRRMAENIHDGLTMKENDQVVYLNERACEIFGYPRDELANMTDIDLAAPGEKERLKQIIEETGKKGVSPGEIEFWIVRKDGTRRYIRNRYSMSRDGGMTERFVITTDITERKLAEDERRKRLMRFLLEDGNLYLVKEREPTLSLEAFNDLLKIGYEGTVISRTPKKNLKRSIEYYFDLYWLGEGAGKRSSPTLADLEQRIGEMRGKSVLLIDRLDYLMFKNGFKKTLSFVYRLRDIAYLRELVIILSIDPSTVKEDELILLEKETREIEPQNVPRPGEDVFDIVELIFEKNNTGVKPSYTQIGTELGISKPTSRKRIRRLVAAGYVAEIEKGNRKILELTQKGRSLFFK